MADQTAHGAAATSESPRANLAFGLGLAAFATWVIAIVANGDGDKYDWIWPIMAVFGLAAPITGFTAREGGRLRGRALVGAVIGGLAVLVFLAFVIGDALG